MERKVFSLEESSGAFSGTAMADMVYVQVTRICREERVKSELVRTGPVERNGGKLEKRRGF
jgi:hypothetical protein